MDDIEQQLQRQPQQQGDHRAAPRSWLAYSLFTILVHIAFLAITLVQLIQLINLHHESASRLLTTAIVLDSIVAFLTCSHLVVTYYNLSMDAYDEWNGGQLQRSNHWTRGFLLIFAVLVVSIVSIKGAHFASESSSKVNAKLASHTGLNVVFPLLAFMLVFVTLGGTYWKVASGQTRPTFPIIHTTSNLEGFDPDTTLVQDHDSTGHKK